MARANGPYLKEIVKIERQHLPIIDNFGFQPLDGQTRITLLEIIEDRHEKRTFIMTS